MNNVLYETASAASTSASPPRLFPDASGNLVEESDRYAQALLYRDLARDCFDQAEYLATSS